MPAAHKDPFDRLLIAQAVEENLTLVSVDPLMRDDPVGLQRKGVNDVGGRVGDRDRICHGSTSSFKSLAA